MTDQKLEAYLVYFKRLKKVRDRGIIKVDEQIELLEELKRLREKERVSV